MLLLHLYCHAIFGHSGSNCTSVITKNPPKFDPFKVTQGHIHTDRATYDFLLVILIHSNHGLISYRFRDNWQFLLKIANFPIPVFNAPNEGVPFGIL